jgi:hypothetical protein
LLSQYRGISDPAAVDSIFIGIAHGAWGMELTDSNGRIVFIPMLHALCPMLDPFMDQKLERLIKPAAESQHITIKNAIDLVW